MITSDTSTTPSHQSPSSSSSLNDLADILIQKLDRSKIFPPHLNNPEQLMNLTRRSDERPPRPPNGFLLCRKNVHQEAKINGICNMRVISKVSGMLWRSASPDEKEQYEKLAIQVHNLHSEKYPNYKYRPNNTIVNTNLSHHHHHHNKLPSATFSPYGLPSPPYSNISTPTIATTLPYFHPNHHHYPGHHHPNHHLVNHHTSHQQQLNHHSLSHHSLNNNNQNHHQLSHHSPLPHLPHLNHPLPHSQQQLKNITKHHTTNNHINHHQSPSSSSHHHHPYANHHHHHHQFIPSSTTVATNNNNNTLSPIIFT
ncbi:15045_t:CDS:2 [Entrophospora sp. SA101]|nr:15045_t:CDS:2 [Entrophospora sp. SA101]